MSTRCLTWGHCPTHGHALFAARGCVSCHPTVAAAPPQPRAVRKPIRRTGIIGRPRTFDLTAREREIALLLAHGKTQPEVALQLGVTRAAINSNVQRSLDRIGATRTWELFQYVTRGL